MADEAEAQASRRHRAFIAANWETLAALAWRGYLSLGRGALRVRESLFIDAPPGDLLLGQVAYVREEAGAIGELVSSYDPEREIVCSIARADGARTYQLRG